jgi:uncharacterized membrane protein YoaK (UPF0700 family)
VILTGVTGLVDAATVLALGKVFAANMTGNVVFLGFALAGVEGFDAGLFIVALLAFAFGAVAAGRITLAHAERSTGAWLRKTAVVEAALLAISAALCFGSAFHDPLPMPVVYTVLALTSLAMGLRNAAVRSLKVPDMSTTVLTLTVTGLASDSPLGSGGNANWGRRTASILAMLIGAALGALLVVSFGASMPLALAAIVTTAATFYYTRS